MAFLLLKGDSLAKLWEPAVRHGSTFSKELTKETFPIVKRMLLNNLPEPKEGLERYFMTDIDECDAAPTWYITRQKQRGNAGFVNPIRGTLNALGEPLKTAILKRKRQSCGV